MRAYASTYTRRYGTLSLACGDAAAARGFLLQALEIAPAHAGALAGL